MNQIQQKVIRKNNSAVCEYELWEIFGLDAGRRKKKKKKKVQWFKVRSKTD